MTEPTRCLADFLDATVECDLPAGHEGDHECTFTWEQFTQLPLPASGVASPGYASFLKGKYAT